MALSIRIQLTAWYSLILALSLCLFGGFAYYAMRQSIRTTLDAGLRQRMIGIQDIIIDEAHKGLPALQEELSEFADGQGEGVKLRVNYANGSFIYASSGLQPLQSGDKFSRIHHPFFEHWGGIQYRAQRRDLEAAGVHYDAEVAISTADFSRVLHDFRITLYFATPVFFLLGTIGGIWISRRALAPVDAMTRIAVNIGAENLTQRLSVPRTGDELERLGNTLNEMLARLEAAFQRITQFTADASHELRTPVSVMRVNAELMLRKARSEEEYREALAQILRETEKVTLMIEQLMALARADSGAAVLSLTRMNLAEPLEKTCREMRVFAEAKHLELHVQLPVSPVWVRGDVLSLERLFRILLDNAIKYTPERGRIFVDLHSDKGWAVVAIRDTGVGISATDLPHIFERFYRVDRSRSREMGGTGLGLAIGHWIAEAHSGEIQVKSQPEQGSSFEVRLPLYEN